MNQNSLKAPPYVGVTGFMPGEVEQVLDCVPTLEDLNGRQLMTGVLASGKTVTGFTNSLGNKFPHRADIAKTFVRDPRFFRCIHFATDELARLYDQLMLSIDFGGDLLDGFQLNIVWPDPIVLARVRQQAPYLRFVLQVSPHLIGYAAKSPWQIAQEVKHRYDGLLEHIIVDFSRGMGVEMAPGRVIDYLKAFSKSVPSINLVLAGGLHAGNLKQLVEPLAQTFPGRLSNDAEGKLRDNPENAGGTLSLARARSFVIKSFELFRATDTLTNKCIIAP